MSRPRLPLAALAMVGALVVVVAGLAGCGARPESPAAAATSVHTGADTSTSASTTSRPPTSAAAPATSAPSTGVAPPFVRAATWVRGSGGRSLHVVPTSAGRVAQGPGDEDEAWSEVLRLAADADQPGMRAQFDCHWTYARFVQPDKPSWNLEPWRPVVSPDRMVEAACNPGGPESADG